MKTPDLMYTTYIKTTPKDLWAALITPEFTRQYWGGSANISTWEKGAEWTHASEDGTVHHNGIVEEVTPYERLVISWCTPAAEKDKSRVTFELIPINDAVQLNVIHGDFIDDSVVAQRVSKGWPMVIASMKSYLETGKALDIWSGGSCASSGCDDKTAVA